MTLGSREGIGVDGGKNPSRKPEGCDGEEETGDPGSEDRNTKGDGVEILNPSTAAGSPAGSDPVPPAPVPTQPGPGPGSAQQQQPLTSTEPTPPSHDQHHFLRSSVRPPSKRIRKDSVGSAVNGHGGAKSKGKITCDELLIYPLTCVCVCVCVSQTAICCRTVLWSICFFWRLAGFVWRTTLVASRRTPAPLQPILDTHVPIGQGDAFTNRINI